MMMMMMMIHAHCRVLPVLDSDQVTVIVIVQPHPPCSQDQLNVTTKLTIATTPPPPPPPPPERLARETTTTTCYVTDFLRKMGSSILTSEAESHCSLAPDHRPVIESNGLRGGEKWTATLRYER